MTDGQASGRADFVSRYLKEARRCLEAISVRDVARFLECLDHAYDNDAHVYLIGNGGSAATASHMACDLAKNLHPSWDTPGRRLRVSSLTDNTPLITALANDCGYERVFSEQLRNVLKKGDVVIAISASGRSPNVLEALTLARRRGARTAALLGFDGGLAREAVDVAIVIDSHDYGHVEDLHLVLNHLVTAWLRSRLGAVAAGRDVTESAG